MEARPEEKPNVVSDSLSGATPPLVDVSAMPEARLSYRLSKLPDDELPDFVNPNNSDMPSAEGRLTLECLRALGSADLSSDRRSKIVDTLAPIIESKSGKKIFKSLIGMEDPDDKKLSASGFRNLRNTINAKLQTSLETSTEIGKNDNPSTTDQDSEKKDDTNTELAVNEHVMFRILSERIAEGPDRFFDDELTAIIPFLVRDDGEDYTYRKAFVRAQADFIANSDRHGKEDLEAVAKEWDDFYEEGVSLLKTDPTMAMGRLRILSFAALQMCAIKYVRLLQSPIEQAERLAKDDLESAEMNLGVVMFANGVNEHMSALFLLTSPKYAVLNMIPPGLPKSVEGRLSRCLSAVKARIEADSKNFGSSSLSRVEELHTGAFAKVSKHIDFSYIGTLDY